MSNIQLNTQQINKLFIKLKAELGNANVKRMELLLDELPDTGKLRLSDVLATLYPNQDQQKAQNSLRLFRSRLKHAAEDTSVQLLLVVDSKKKNPVDQRYCWFEGEDETVARLEQFASEETFDTDSDKLVTAMGGAG